MVKKQKVLHRCAAFPRGRQGVECTAHQPASDAQDKAIQSHSFGHVQHLELSSSVMRSAYAPCATAAPHDVTRLVVMQGGAYALSKRRPNMYSLHKTSGSLVMGAEDSFRALHHKESAART